VLGLEAGLTGGRQRSTARWWQARKGSGRHWAAAPAPGASNAAVVWSSPPPAVLPGMVDDSVSGRLYVGKRSGLGWAFIGRLAGVENQRGTGLERPPPSPLAPRYRERERESSHSTRRGRERGSASALGSEWREEWRGVRSGSGSGSGGGGFL
jgi:hypothetical protein